LASGFAEREEDLEPVKYSSDDPLPAEAPEEPVPDVEAGEETQEPVTPPQETVTAEDERVVEEETPAPEAAAPEVELVEVGAVGEFAEAESRQGEDVGAVEETCVEEHDGPHKPAEVPLDSESEARVLDEAVVPDVSPVEEGELAEATAALAPDATDGNGAKGEKHRGPHKAKLFHFRRRKHALQEPGEESPVPEEPSGSGE